MTQGHSRSRGLYVLMPVETGNREGPLPLAQAPLGEVGQPAAGSRVTSASCGLNSGITRIESDDGSAPLARALQSQDVDMGTATRITPARALRPADERSANELPPCAGLRSVSGGSRPSRTGLLPLEAAPRGCQRPRRTRQRIMPFARAPQRCRQSPAQEVSGNSRSRGRYNGKVSRIIVPVESSPLARAAPELPDEVGERLRSTSSRGLHGSTREETPQQVGPLPLARALRSEPLDRPETGGPLPLARALPFPAAWSSGRVLRVLSLGLVDEWCHCGGVWVG